MKTVTQQNIEALVETIIKDRDNGNGVARDVVVSEIDKRLGTDWVIKKVQPVKFTKDDINAVANSRFYRKTGVKYLMLLAIVVLGLATLTRTFQWLPQVAYYALNALVAVVFVYFYSTKQRVVRKELWHGIEGDGINKAG